MAQGRMTRQRRLHAIGRSITHSMVASVSAVLHIRSKTSWIPPQLRYCESISALAIQLARQRATNQPAPPASQPTRPKPPQLTTQAKQGGVNNLNLVKFDLTSRAYQTKLRPHVTDDGGRREEEGEEEEEEEEQERGGSHSKSHLHIDVCAAEGD